jgi:uridylate kinase
MLKDFIEQQGMNAELFCAMPSPEVGIAISQQTINTCLNDGCTLVFTGGTGNPFFTTDTTAVLRALQLNAIEIWKGTSIDVAYDKDPKKYHDARRFAQLSFRQALQDKIGVMDLTAYAMAETYHQRIRIFDIFSHNALLQAAEHNDFGSLIS